MKCLVTTSNAILAIDVSSKEIHLVHQGMGLYYGITRQKDFIIVAARRRMINSETAIEHEKGCLIKLDPFNNKVGILETAIQMRDLHGIESIGNTIWCTCSYDNALALVSEGSTRFVYPLGRPKQPPFDINHLNTILHHEGNLYLMAHNKGRSQIYRLQSGDLSILDVWDIGIHAHDIWFDNGSLRLCSSGESAVVGPDGFRQHVGGFPRGHISNGEHHVIGITQHNKKSERDRSSGLILMTNHKYETISVLNINAFGMILDILELSDEEFDCYACRSALRSEPCIVN